MTTLNVLQCEKDSGCPCLSPIARSPAFEYLEVDQVTVRVCGLKARPELNGRLGRVLGSADEGRLCVQVAGGGRFALKPANFTVCEEEGTRAGRPQRKPAPAPAMAAAAATPTTAIKSSSRATLSPSPSPPRFFAVAYAAGVRVHERPDWDSPALCGGARVSAGEVVICVWHREREAATKNLLRPNSTDRFSTSTDGLSLNGSNSGNGKELAFVTFGDDGGDWHGCHDRAIRWIAESSLEPSDVVSLTGSNFVEGKVVCMLWYMKQPISHAGAISTLAVDAFTAARARAAAANAAANARMASTSTSTSLGGERSSEVRRAMNQRIACMAGLIGHWTMTELGHDCRTVVDVSGHNRHGLLRDAGADADADADTGGGGGGGGGGGNAGDGGGLGSGREFGPGSRGLLGFGFRRYACSEPSSPLVFSMHNRSRRLALSNGGRSISSLKWVNVAPHTPMPTQENRWVGDCHNACGTRLPALYRQRLACFEFSLG